MCLGRISKLVLVSRTFDDCRRIKSAVLDDYIGFRNTVREMKKGRGIRAMASIRQKIHRVSIRHKKERKVYNGFDPEFYGFYP